MAGAALCAAAGCGLIDPPPPPVTDSTTPAPTYSPTQPAPTVNAGVCLDPTLSTLPTFSESIRELVAKTVAGWEPPAPPPTTTSAVDPRPGLNLTIRTVGTNSYGSQIPYLSVTLPPVPGLSARPDVTDPNFPSLNPVWQMARDQVIQQAQAAGQQAQQRAAAIRDLPLDTSQSSEIAGCLSALAQTVPPGPRTLILTSDLEQNEPPQVAGDLHNTRILIVQPCGGDATRCRQLQDQWQQELAGRGAVTVTVIRPELADSQLPPVLHGRP